MAAQTWSVFCKNKPGWNHNEKHGSEYACPNCGQANPNPPLVISSDDEVPALLYRKSRAIASTPPQGRGFISESRDYRKSAIAIAKDKRSKEGRPHAGSSSHEQREKQKLALPIEPTRFRFNVTFWVMNAKGKWEAKGVVLTFLLYLTVYS
jgi:hypothetical protein